MSANCEIITAKKDSVLRISLQALVTKDKKSGVYKIEDGKTKFAEVKTGITEGMAVEIKEGLQENDLIVSGPIKTLMKLTDNQKVIWEEKKEEAAGGKEGTEKETLEEKNEPEKEDKPADTQENLKDK
jgi:hypothetical protein